MAHVSRASGVVMMVGGLGHIDEPISRPIPAPPPSNPAQLDDSARISVIIQPGLALASAGEPGSGSVMSRVMALAPMIDDAARASDVDSALLMAMIDVESGGNPRAVSPKGATGLMQLMPATGAQQGAANLFDPRQNIAAGARYLKQLLRQFGDLQLALAAYNAGEGAVQKYGGQIPPYAETMSYVPKVIARYRRYRAEGSSSGNAPVQAGMNGTAQGLLLVGSGSGAD